MITYGEIKQWREQSLDSAGEALRGEIRSLEAARDTVESTAVPDTWSGFARFAAEARRNQLVASLDGRIEDGRTLMRAFFTAESSVRTLRNSVDDLEGEASAKQFRISDEGVVEDLKDPPEFTAPRQADEYTAERNRLAEGLAEEAGRLVDRAVQIDSALFQAVPYRDEEQERRGLADPEVTQRWGELSMSEKQAVLTQVVEEELADLDLDPPPTVTFIHPDDPDADPDFHENGLNGRWSSSRNEIWIHPDTLDDPQRLGTAAHEARHARQSDAVDDLGRNPWEFLTGQDPFEQHEDAGISREEAEEWEENFDNYVDSDEDPEGYYTQPVEEDAFDRGSDFVDGLTPEELERLLEESS